MRVTILTLGSRGDVEPYVALGVGLVRIGHAVRLATLEPFRDFVRDHGLDFHPLPDPLATLKQSSGWSTWQSSSAAWWTKLRGLRATIDESRTGLLQNFDACAAACQRADAVLSAFTGIVGPFIADRVGAVHAWALVQPSTPTGAFPHFLAPFHAPAGGVVNRATYRIADVGFRWMFGHAVASWLARRGDTVRDFRYPGADGRPVLYGFSTMTLPADPAWHSRAHVTGYWHLDGDQDWAAPDELVQFLDEGPPPICVCHASITGWIDRRASLELICDTIERTGRRAVILTEQDDLVPRRLRPSCLALDWAPASWLFPRASVIVHHGGAGTTAAALRAGRPSVVLPSCFDQPFWADALVRLGAAPRPLLPSRLDAGALAARIRAAETATFVGAAARCAARLQAEDGVKTAVTILNGYFSQAAVAHY